jgi:hypothetical protein
MTTKEKLLLAGILLVALGFRLWGIQFGLPSLYHPDEVNKVEIAQTMFRPAIWIQTTSSSRPCLST